MQIVPSPYGLFVLTDDGRLFERMHDPRAFNRPTGAADVFLYRPIRNLPGRVVSIAQSPAALFVVLDDGRLLEQRKNSDNPLGITYSWHEVAPPPPPPTTESML